MKGGAIVTKENKISSRKFRSNVARIMRKSHSDVAGCLKIEWVGRVRLNPCAGNRGHFTYDGKIRLSAPGYRTRIMYASGDDSYTRVV